MTRMIIAIILPNIVIIHCNEQIQLLSLLLELLDFNVT